MKSAINSALLLLPIVMLNLSVMKLPWYWSLSLYTYIIIVVQLEKYIRGLEVIGMIRNAVGEKKFKELSDELENKLKEKENEN